MVNELEEGKFEMVEHLHYISLVPQDGIKTVKLKEKVPFSNEIRSKMYACKLGTPVEEMLEEAEDEHDPRRGIAERFRDKMKEERCKEIEIPTDQKVYIDSVDDETSFSG
jgi:hypothetical protein